MFPIHPRVFPSSSHSSFFSSSVVSRLHRGGGSKNQKIIIFIYTPRSPSCVSAFLHSSIKLQSGLIGSTFHQAPPPLPPNARNQLQLMDRERCTHSFGCVSSIIFPFHLRYRSAAAAYFLLVILSPRLRLRFRINLPTPPLQPPPPPVPLCASALSASSLLGSSTRGSPPSYDFNSPISR